MKTILSLITLTILSTSLISQTKISMLMNRIDEVYPDLEVQKEVKRFETILIEKGIIELKDMLEPSVVYNKMEESMKNYTPQDFKIKQYTKRAALDSFLESENLDESASTEQSNLALFTYYLLLSEKHRDIKLQLEEKRLVKLNNEDLPIESFDPILFEEIKKRTDSGIDINNARIIITAEPYTDIEFVNFIMSKVREVGIRNVKFERSE